MAAQGAAVLTAETESAEETPVEELTAEDLIEDVSIDGMCGVY